MIEKGNLSEFNKANIRNISECKDPEITAILSDNNNLFPQICLLLTETTRFYTENFSDLQKHIKREKRLVVFETPSRVSMTHEYTIEGANDLSQGFHFLFNTRERLSWLKIFLEDRRVSIASRAKVVSLLSKQLGEELEKLASLLNRTKDELAFNLYDLSDGKPCFIEYNQKEYKGQQSLLLSITFFDSIRNKTKLRKKRWWSPLQEKEITYNYSTISGNANAWIYFKSPTSFILSATHNAGEGKYEVSPSNDDEITSLVLTPKGNQMCVDFNISINVPNALKVWYNIMLYLSYAGVLWGIVLIGLKTKVSISNNIIETFSNCSYAIIAALIATRGWLMSEEQVMKKISNQYTTIICILISLIIYLSFACNKLSKTTTITEVMNQECFISNDTNIDNTHNNVNIFIDDTLDLQDSIKPTTSGSLQVPITTSQQSLVQGQSDIPSRSVTKDVHLECHTEGKDGDTSVVDRGKRAEECLSAEGMEIETKQKSSRQCVDH